MDTLRLTQRFDAPASAVHRALVDPDAVSAWMFPDGMSIHGHRFDARVGGEFRVARINEGAARVGKTSARTDTCHGRFVELTPNERIVEVLEFETADLVMRAMKVAFVLSETEEGAELEARHEDVPAGIASADNEEGWRMSLARLKRLVERTGV